VAECHARDAERVIQEMEQVMIQACNQIHELKAKIVAIKPRDSFD
jgi:hypothetical protein